MSAQGLARPQFAYGYQVLDDPSVGGNVKGNGDGTLQVGERVKLRVNVSNRGEGPALDTWVTLRNLSGEAVFLHTGRERLKEMQPGDHRVVELDVEVKETPEFGEAVLQLTVSDNKIAEALSEKVVFDVRDTGVAVESTKTGVAATGKIDLYSAPTGKGFVIGRAAEGTKFQATGKTADWYRVGTGDGVFAFAKASDVKKLGKNVGKSGKVEPAYIVSPPRVTLMGTVSQTEEESVHFSGVASDEDAVRDVFITVYNPSRNLFGDREKVFYQASKDPTSGKLEFAADVPLTPGNNIIEVHARQNDDVVAVKRMWVLRTSGLKEARAKEHGFKSHGQLRVDTFK